MRETVRELVGMFFAILRRDVILMLRYPVNSVGGIATAILFFVMILWGGRTVGGEQFDNALGAIIVGYFLVTMSITAYQSLANQVTTEASWGTLERIYMSPVGFGRVMVLMATSSILFSFFWGFVILLIIIVLSGESIVIHFGSVSVVVFFALLSILGLGLIFGGAAVRFKRISNIFNLFQFLFFALVAAPVQQYPLLKALPLAQGSFLLQRIMNDGHRIWELAPTEVGILVTVGLVYFLVGYVIFQAMTYWSRQAGVMGHY